MESVRNIKSGRFIYRLCSTLGFILAAITFFALSGCGGGGSGSPASSTPPAFTVGGTVSGLTGSGLVLSLDNQKVTINANGPFVFTRPLASGSQFHVTLTAQPVPAGQTCAVTNSSGTIGNANVSGVVVECVASRFTLGGSVSGMQGSGLVLTDGYDARVTVDSNGSFIFPTSFAPNTWYAVGVERQPSGPVQCRAVSNNRSGYITASNVTTVAIECDRTKPPPYLRYCDLDCPDAQPIVVKICASTQPNCEPSRSTRVQLRVDNNAVSGGTIIVNGLNGGTMTLLSGTAGVTANIIQIAQAPFTEVRSDLDVTFSYYNVLPAWGSVTNIDFQSSFASSSVMGATFYRHISYNPDVTIESVLSQSLAVVATERQIVDKTSEAIDAFFLPTELAAGEGNFSFADGRVTINYGNPPYIDAVGGLIAATIPRFAHEHAHELFDEIRPRHQIESLCLNEGFADALGFVSGFMPEADFGPVGVAGINFETDGCGAAARTHDIGNCPLWHIKRLNMLTPSFMRSLAHPQHPYAFNSCKLSESQTGNALFIMFTEAADGADVRPALDAAGISHAPTYADALRELGW